MPIFVVTYEHPNEAGWAQHVMPHVAWLKERVADGSLLASGPYPGKPVKAALLIISAPDRAGVEQIITSDPFAIEGLIENMTINEWDPIFGAFSSHSTMPGL